MAMSLAFMMLTMLGRSTLKTGMRVNPELDMAEIVGKSRWESWLIMNTSLMRIISDSTWVFCMARADCRMCISVLLSLRLPLFGKLKIFEVLFSDIGEIHFW